MRTKVYALLMFGVACTKSDGTKSSNARLAAYRDRVATVTNVMSIGPRSLGPEYKFENILDLLPMPDGSVWVCSVDQTDAATPPAIRTYDSAGRFVRQVGAFGKGPGEYLTPYAMARLNDGRVAVRDNSSPERILLYEADGSAHADMITDGRTGWPKIRNFRWMQGRIDAIRADSFGVVWLPFDATSIATDSGTVFSAQYARVRPGGQFIDIVDSPEVPKVRLSRITSSKMSSLGMANVSGMVVPYQPAGAYAWSPGANFAVARTDRYQIEVMDLQVVREPGDHSPTPPPRVVRVIKRNTRVVQVEKAEQDSIRAKWKRDALERHVDSTVIFPAPPQTKPPISHFQYSDDGQLLVWIAQPSVLADGHWVEPQAIDVFDQRGDYTGRINLPSSFQLVRMNRNVIWGITRISTGGDVPERRTIQW